MGYIFTSSDEESALKKKRLSDINNIPEELKEKGLFCCVRGKRKESGKFVKIPYTPIKGSPANANNKESFASFEEAREDYYWELNEYDGIGFLLTDKICLIDLDDAYIDGQLSPIAKRIVSIMNSYTEISFNGQGIHILFKVKENFKFDRSKHYIKNPNNKVEIYITDTRRYSTITGDRLNENEIEERTTELEKLLDQFMLRDEPIIPRAQKNNSKILSKVRKIDNYSLLDRIRNSKSGEKFSLLFDFGNWEENYNSQSEADMELAGILAFWTAKDFERIEKFMWSSKLARPKWEKNKGYLKRTIEKAISNCRNIYNPR